MPTTNKRNYPYPASQGVPPNVPLALENLANAVEEDLERISRDIPEGEVSRLESRATSLESRVSQLEAWKPPRPALYQKELSASIYGIGIEDDRYYHDTGIKYDRVVGCGLVSFESEAKYSYGSGIDYHANPIPGRGILYKRQLANGNLGVALSFGPSSEYGRATEGFAKGVCQVWYLP